MHELTELACEGIGGGFPLLPAVGFAIGLLTASGVIYDFCSGVLDGFNAVH